MRVEDVFKIDNLPLSAAQAAVWLDLQLNPNDISYSIWTHAELNGAIDYDRLIDAIRHVVSHSTALRLTFSGDALHPRQTIEPNCEFEIPIIDLSSELDPTKAALAWMSSDHRRPFELNSRKPLFRNALLKLSATKLVWYRNFHHLVNDGYGLGVLSAWVADAYLAINLGNPLRTSYGDYLDYLAAESEYRQSFQYQEDREFWNSMYAELPQPLSLSVHAGRASKRREFHMSRTWLSPDLLAALSKLEDSVGVSLGHILVAIVAMYLHRVTGAKVVPLCIPLHGREKDTMAMMGMCVNTLPLSFQLDPSNFIFRVIQQVSADIKRSMVHRRYRYEDLRKDWGLQGGDVSPFRISANILRTVDACIFGDHPMHVDTLSAGPVDDLTFIIFENRADPTRFRLSLFFNPLLYDDWEIDAHRSYFQRFMNQIAINLNRMLRDVELISESERRSILYDWNKRSESTPRRQCLHELFEDQVRSVPEAVAIIYEDSQLTYRELDDRADKLAGYLAALGVRSEDVIGLCVDRCPDMIVGVVGIMKAGAAYLPLDPDLPASRLEFMIKDANVTIIVTQAAHELVLPDHLSRLVFIDANWSEIDRSATLRDANVQPHNLAYVIYTSGSTGQPKGVLIQHEGLSNLATTQAELFHVRTHCRVLQFARLSFDASISEIAMTLAVGATLVLAQKHELRPGNLNKLLLEKKINVVTLPPSILPSLRHDEYPDLETLVVAGESCPIDVAVEWRGRCRFINAYGPTETTVCATCGEYTGGGTVSIGRPLPNTSAYILDDQLRPVPIGIAGELYIGGVGVARGYLNRLELDAEKFVSHPFVESGGRLYRSGDLARYLPDGTIEFLGRIDRQFKIRGFRVELGEIESALLHYTDIVECAVVVRDNGARKEIIAYLVIRDRSSQTESATIKKWLRQKLPDYMIPSLIIFVDAIPRTPSGKLDRKALPQRDDSTDRGSSYIPPNTNTERELAGIWGRIVGVEAVGIGDNFFEIGGDSLGCIEIITAVWEMMSVDLPAQDVFECENLEALAQRIDAIAASRDAGSSRNTLERQ